MSEVVFSIARDFSRFPGPRFARQGPHSGETLRRELKRQLSGLTGELVVDLDGTTGYGSSFLDEAFGGLVRSEHFPRDQLLAKLQFRSRLDPSYVDEILDSINKAEPELPAEH